MPDNDKDWAPAQFVSHMLETQTMRAWTPGHIHPFWLHGSRGLLLAIYYPPVAAPHPLGNVLLAPPFAEEMNRCRAMVSMQARAFSRLGIGTLLLDPYGTGDSAGDFADSSWELWCNDLKRGIEWLRRSANGCRTLWGIRLGAIAASELAVQDSGIDRLLFWQPVVQGKSYFTQFLRIRIAAEMERRDGIKTTEELRKRSAAGETIEVSGYPISPDLARRLDEVRLPDASDMLSLKLAWFEVLSAEDINVSPANLKVIEGYRSGAVDMACERSIGPPFWQVHERAVAPDLIDATARVVSAWTDTAVPLAQPADASRDRLPDISLQAPDSEYPLVCGCLGSELIAVVHRGESSRRRGVVIVVAGGPQYRVGAHRQFVSLARRLAARGYPVLRFDLRGMGDSGGSHLGYQHSESDIRAAIDALTLDQPQVDEVVLFGECESASGILFYAYQDSRVKGIVLVNPWVRTEEGRAQVIMKHYYVKRLLSREFWRKFGSGEFRLRESLLSFFQVLSAYLRGRKALAKNLPALGEGDISDLPLPMKTAAGLRRFGGAVMILMSGRDYIAKEFDEVTGSSSAWRGLLDDPRICRRVVVDADHTFSRDIWKQQISDWTSEWLGSW